MSYTECDQEDLHSWHWTHYPDVLEDDPILHRHLSLRTNPRLPHGLPSEPCFVHDGRRSLGGNLVPNLPHHPDHNGPFSSSTSLCWQQTVPCRSFLGLRNLLCQLSAPGVLRPPNHFRNGTRSGVPGLNFALSSNLSHYATAPHVTSTRSWHHFLHHLWRCNYQASSHDSFWSPNVRTLPRNGLEVLPYCIVCTEQQVFANPI